MKGDNKMTVSEAIKNLQMELECREKDIDIDCLNYEYCLCLDCPYNVSSDTLTESMQVVIDWFQKGEEK